MAKQKSFIKIEGTFGGMTVVNSKSYGEHLRNPRGTFKKAKINEALQESAKAIIVSNVRAKVIKDVLDPFRANFYDGKMWSRLVSHFKTGKLKKEVPDFLSLVDFEIHCENPLDRISNIKIELLPDCDGGTIKLNLHINIYKKFRSRHIDGCLLSVIGIYPDVDNEGAEATEVKLPLLPIGVDLHEQLPLSVPKGARTVLICVKAEGCENGKPSSVLKTKGMKIIGGFEVGPLK